MFFGIMRQNPHWDGTLQLGMENSCDLVVDHQQPMNIGSIRFRQGRAGLFQKMPESQEFFRSR